LFASQQSDGLARFERQRASYLSLPGFNFNVLLERDEGSFSRRMNLLICICQRRYSLNFFLSPSPRPRLRLSAVSPTKTSNTKYRKASSPKITRFAMADWNMDEAGWNARPLLDSGSGSNGIRFRRPADTITPSSERPSAHYQMLLYEPFFPGQPKSLAGIAMRAFCLGLAFAIGALSTIATLLLTASPLWRVPFFLASLAAFHFLEFWTTAERNTLVAGVDSFLLTANWPAYAIAHAAAFAECALVGALFPRRSWAPAGLGPALLAIGLAMVVVGQFVRSAAMLQAGASFNHHVQTRKADSHQLVTSGVYAVLRHPSYFGFFYWGLGTQLVLGNSICFFAYAAVLWMFFSDRVRKEEAKLVEFFKDDYIAYRQRVRTWMPFIR
jgi:protein-S-isoprenylcysteine O-methyltransferase